MWKNRFVLQTEISLLVCIFEARRNKINAKLTANALYQSRGLARIEVIWLAQLRTVRIQEVFVSNRCFHSTPATVQEMDPASFACT